MGSIMYWRFPGRGTLITIGLIGFNTATLLVFVGAMVYVLKSQVTTRADLATSVLAKFAVRGARGHPLLACLLRLLLRHRDRALTPAHRGAGLCPTCDCADEEAKDAAQVPLSQLVDRQARGGRGLCPVVRE